MTINNIFNIGMMMNLKLKALFWNIITPQHRKTLISREQVNYLSPREENKILIRYLITTVTPFMCVVLPPFFIEHLLLSDNSFFTILNISVWVGSLFGVLAINIICMKRAARKFLKKKMATHHFLHNEAELIQILYEKENQLIIVGFVENLIQSVKKINPMESIELNNKVSFFIQHMHSSTEELLYTFNSLVKKIEYVIMLIEQDTYKMNVNNVKEQSHQSLLTEFNAFKKEYIELSCEQILEENEIEFEYNYKQHL